MGEKQTTWNDPSLNLVELAIRLGDINTGAAALQWHIQTKGPLDNEDGKKMKEILEVRNSLGKGD